MATVRYVEEAGASDKIKEIYGEIKKMFGIPFVPNLFKAMANHPAYLETTWLRFKAIMAPWNLNRRPRGLVSRPL